MKSPIFTSTALGILVAFSSISHADEPDPNQLPDLGSAQQNQVHGNQLMTDQERVKFRARMQAASSAEERQALREEQHRLMQKRAEEQGVTLAPMPQKGGQRGMGMGRGMGQGMRGQW